MKELKGMCVALCTPFTEDGEKVDITAFKNHMDSMLEAGVHIILICAGTGEFAYLRKEEKRQLVEIASKHINGRAIFMVQTSSVNTVDGVEAAKHAQDHGADCLLVLPPYFEGPSYDGVYYHFERISAAVKTPIMVYNIPASSNIDITPEFLNRLSTIDNVQYIKDSTNDLTRIQQLVTQCGDRVGIFNGGDSIAYYAMAFGCVGCVWGAVNAMPKEAVELYNLVVAGNLVDGMNLWKRMYPANNFFDTHDYIPAVKAATNLTGRKVGPARKPLMSLKESEMNELRDALKPLGV
jgi:4-hydroxy-tetrahydrodipicolinate synthase